MTMHLNKGESRRNAYLERATRARACAKMLMPLTFLVMGTGLWQDPVLGPKLMEGVEVVRPVAAGYLADTPFADLLGPVPEEDLAENAVAEEGVEVASNLPTSRVPVNRN